MTGVEVAAVAVKEAAKQAAVEASKEVAKETAKTAVAEAGKEAGAGLDVVREVRVLGPKEVPTRAPWEKNGPNPFSMRVTTMPEFDKIIEKENSAYERMKDSLKAYFKDLGIEIKVDPLQVPGGTKPDILGRDKDGRLVVGEIKTEDEAGGNNNWESHWRKLGLFEKYSDALNSLSTEAKGWCAVIDGQLREYCEKMGVDNGYLVVENGEQFEKSIEESLQFLKEEGRIKGWEKTGTDAKGNTVYRIFYN